ncbi:hypothetical protein QFC21_005126 [Naganishia friedmannii]|uniref:Uncharacterized protein n=1 Tax=Naganishia friedmannii TaxID=89922 RepID=A0ACC2VCJ4_9TREE|nr:hypothetical protein QFC21_005126 [Naganishia friedmannii]
MEREQEDSLRAPLLRERLGTECQGSPCRTFRDELRLESNSSDKVVSTGQRLQQHHAGPIELLTPSLSSPREAESFLPETGHKHVYIRLGESGASAVTSETTVPAYPPAKHRTRQPASYKTAKKEFFRIFPKYKATEATTGKILAKEYAILLGGQETYADYGGDGQPMQSVLKAANRFLQTHIMGNPHSSNASSCRSSHFESLARTSALRFLSADPERYTLIWTANASAALGLVRQHYFEDVKRTNVSTTVVMCEDMHNSVNGIRTIVAEDSVLARLVTIVVLPVDLATLRIDEELFCNTTRKLETDERGMVLLTAQSNVSGVKHPYSSLLRHAKSNGWDTVLDAAALLPTAPFDLASHPEIDAVPISWYKIVGQPCFGALLVTNSFFSRLHKNRTLREERSALSVTSRSGILNLSKAPKGFRMERDTIGLVFYASTGNRTPFAPLFERLKLFGIDLRSGLEPIKADHGVVRVSLGAPSTFEDVYRIYEFAQSLLSHPLGTDSLVVPKKRVSFNALHELQQLYSRWSTPILMEKAK